MQLASASDDIKLWDCNGYILHKQFSPHSRNVSSLTWSNDNSVIASASTGGDKVVLTYPESSSFTYSIAEKERITCVDFNASSRYVLGGSQTGAVHVWDLKSNSLKRTYNGHKKNVTAVQFNFNDSVIASGSDSGEIVLFNIVTAIGSSPLTYANSQAVKHIQYSHFKKSLFGSCTESGAVCLWDANKRQLVNSFTSHAAPVMGVAFSPLNEMLLMSAGLDKRIVCYDVQGKKPVRTMIADSPLTSIDLMHDGATLAVGTTRGKIYIYDLRKGAEPIRTITAHSGPVQALKFQYKVSKDASGKLKSVNSMKKASSITNVSNNLKRPTVEKVNGTTDVKTYSDQDPRSKDTSSIKPAETEDMFSPIKEGMAPGSPAVDCAGDGAVGISRNNSSMNNHADDVFSPVESNKENVPHSSTRGQPIGGIVESMSGSFIGSSHTVENNTIIGDTKYSVDVHNNSLNEYQYTQSSNRTDIQYRSGSSPHHAHGSIPFTSKAGSSTTNTTISSSQPSSTHLSRTLPPPSSLSSSSHNNKLSETNMITPPEATPSGGGAEGGVNTGALTHHSQVEGATGGGHHQPFQAQFIKSMIEDALDDFKDQVRQDVLNLHMEMIKQFQIHQAETRMLLQQYSVNEELLQEIERLKEENNKLKKTY